VISNLTVIEDNEGDTAEVESFASTGIIGLTAIVGDRDTFLAFTPAQARELAADLTARADEIEASR